MVPSPFTKVGSLAWAPIPLEETFSQQLHKDSVRSFIAENSCGCSSAISSKLSCRLPFLDSPCQGEKDRAAKVSATHRVVEAAIGVAEEFGGRSGQKTRFFSPKPRRD